MLLHDQKPAAEYALDNLTSAIERYYRALKKDEEKQRKDDEKLLSRYAPTIKTEGVSGIYAIKVDEKILYIGQSKTIHTRILGHIYSIIDCTTNIMLGEHVEKKYEILATAILTGHRVEFVVLCECSKDKDELNEKEMYYINYYNSPLNTYRPKRHKIPNTLEEALAA